MISNFLKILGLQPRISKVFLESLEQFFLTVGQNNFGNKIPYLNLYLLHIQENFFPLFNPFKIKKLKNFKPFPSVLIFCFPVSLWIKKLRLKRDYSRVRNGRRVGNKRRAPDFYINLGIDVIL